MMEMKLLAAIFGGVVAGFILLIWLVIQAWKQIDNPKVKTHLEQMLYIVDEQCDNLEIPAKRIQTIMAIQQLMGWKRIFLPTVIVGFILDVVVKTVRKIGVPDLHQEVKPNADSN